MKIKCFCDREISVIEKFLTVKHKNHTIKIDGTSGIGTYSIFIIIENNKEFKSIYFDDLKKEEVYYFDRIDYNSFILDKSIYKFYLDPLIKIDEDTFLINKIILDLDKMKLFALLN